MLINFLYYIKWFCRRVFCRNCHYISINIFWKREIYACGEDGQRWEVVTILLLTLLELLIIFIILEYFWKFFYLFHVVFSDKVRPIASPHTKLEMVRPSSIRIKEPPPKLHVFFSSPLAYQDREHNYHMLELLDYNAERDMLIKVFKDVHRDGYCVITLLYCHLPLLILQWPSILILPRRSRCVMRCRWAAAPFTSLVTACQAACASRTRSRGFRFWMFRSWAVC